MYQKMKPYYVQFELEELAQQLGNNYAVGYDGGGGTYRILIWNANETNKCFETAIAFASCMCLLVYYNSDDPRVWSFSKPNSCKNVTSLGQILTLDRATNSFRTIL